VPLLVAGGGVHGRGTVPRREPVPVCEPVDVPDVGEQPPQEAGRVIAEQVEQDLTFVGLGAGEGERDRQAGQGGEQVQAQRPEVA
jgi:hypothetical protein